VRLLKREGDGAVGLTVQSSSIPGEMGMAQLIAPPPNPPYVALADDDELKRLHFHLWQLLLTALTVLVTTWFCTLGPIPGILAILVAKHVLVAILVMGLGVDQPRPVEAWRTGAAQDS